MRWTAQKIACRIALIEPLVYRRRHPLLPFRYAGLPGPLAAPLVDPKLDDSHWRVVEPGTYWGEWMMDFMLRSRFQVPDDWDPGLPIALFLPLGESGDFSHPETLVYVDGVAYAACDRHHQEIRLPDHLRDGRPHALALHGWTGLGGLEIGEPNLKLFMRPCAVTQIDQPVRDFLATARTALGVVEYLKEDDPARGCLLNALDAAFNVLDTREPFGDAFYASVPPARAVLQSGIAHAGPPLDVDIVATGHAHIDMAWLWTLGQARRKAGRTFHTVLRLMERFPEYHFTQSQPQLYDFVRQDYPELFETI
jgi:alpha-mannosidase